MIKMSYNPDAATIARDWMGHDTRKLTASNFDLVMRSTSTARLLLATLAAFIVGVGLVCMVVLS